MHVYRRLPAGIAAEHIALHGGAQLSVTMHQMKGIEVAEHAAKHRNFIGKAGHFPEELAVEEVAVHVIVHLALKATMAIEHQAEFRRRNRQILFEVHLAVPHLDWTFDGPEDQRPPAQTLNHVEGFAPMPGQAFQGLVDDIGG